MYGSEILGAYGSEIVDKVQNKYKYVLNMNKNISTNMVLWEVGRIFIR